MIKLLIVDDSALMRRQLVTLFESEGDFSIHQARNGSSTADLFRTVGFSSAMSHWAVT